jgi:hypothetical protein
MKPHFILQLVGIALLMHVGSPCLRAQAYGGMNGAGALVDRAARPPEVWKESAADVVEPTPASKPQAQPSKEGDDS